MIYFDNAATTKPYRFAIEKASIFNNESYYNPSALYAGGLNNSNEIKKAKESILSSLHAVNFEVIFTSSGTESDNMAIFGCVKRGAFATCLGQHSAVYKPFLALKEKGNNVYFCPLNKDGSINEKCLYDYVLANKTDFVSLIHVNNETGAINNVNAIAKNLKSINPKIIVHVDGVQAYGKINYSLCDEIDLYAISAHKINALKGVGALIKKKKLNVSPLIYGGGQEGGLRSGTENVFGIKVLEYTSKEHFDNLNYNFNYVLTLKNAIINGLDKENFIIISGENSSPYILTLSAVGLRGEVVMHALESKGIYVGNGSACSSKNRYSRVIEACGYDNNILDGVIRISFSPENTMNEVNVLVKELNDSVKNLKRILN